MAKKNKDSKETNDKGSIKTEVVYDLKDLPGVGDTTVKKLKDAGIAVSYTHLTLPTILLV